MKALISFCLTLLALALPGDPSRAELATPALPAAAPGACIATSQSSSTPTSSTQTSAMHGAPLLQMALTGQPGALFESTFGAAIWSGALLKRVVSLDTEGQLQIGAVEWDAAAVLMQQAPAQRQIYTLGADHAIIPLEWHRLSSAQRNELDLSPVSHSFDGLGQQRIDFLRGERSLEIGQPAGIFPARQSVLGNPLGGPPVLVGMPSTAIEDATYQAFFEQHKVRRPALYIGANDAMLHAFDAQDGHELFAYVPPALLPRLADATTVQTGSAPVLDGAASALEAQLNGQWKTILLSGLGSAARGMFALDVSDPAFFERGSAALWEFGVDDDVDLGHVMAAPVVAKFKIRVIGGVPQYRYFAVTSSGLDDVGSVGSVGGSAALFLLALDKLPAAPWVLGMNYFKFTTPALTGAAAALSAPALAVGADGAVLYAYAGDWQGNLWRFDFTGPAPWSNNVGPGHDGGAAQPLFVARDADGVRQSITQQPTLVFAPGGGYLVVVGTGKPLLPLTATVSIFQTQSLYAIHDTLATPPELVSGRAALLARTLGGSVDSAGGFTISGAEQDGGSADALHQGWYFDFLQSARSGERSLSSAILADGTLFFNTTIPGQGACVIPTARSYHLDVLTGLIGMPGSATGPAHSTLQTGQLLAGSLAAPALLIDRAHTRSVRNATGGAVVQQQLRVINLLGVDGAFQGDGAPISVSSTAGRMGWREIANWPQLHAQAH